MQRLISNNQLDMKGQAPHLELLCHTGRLAFGLEADKQSQSDWTLATSNDGGSSTHPAREVRGSEGGQQMLLCHRVRHPIWSYCLMHGLQPVGIGTDKKRQSV
eukprot:gene2687-12919_t